MTKDLETGTDIGALAERIRNPRCVLSEDDLRQTAAALSTLAAENAELKRQLAGYEEDWRAVYEAIGLSRDETDSVKIAACIMELRRCERQLAEADAVVAFNSMDATTNRLLAKQPENEKRGVIDRLEQEAIARHASRQPGG